MVAVIKINSITDVITNSSSEVFVCDDSTSNSILNSFGEIIDWSWISQNNNSTAIKMMVDICGISNEELSFAKWLDYFKEWIYNPTAKEYEKFLEEFKDEIQENIIDKKLYFVNIEDYCDGDDVITGHDIVDSNYIWHKSCR